MASSSVTTEQQDSGAVNPEKGPRTLISDRTCSLLGVQIISSGSYLPDVVVSNEQLRDERGFDPDWIRQRTGILSRRHLPQSQATSDMAVEAAKVAIDRANVDPADIDLLLVGTFTPDYCCPSTACLVQDRLSLDCPAVDLQAACSGFMYALVTGSQFVATGNSKLALIVGADCNSRIVDPSNQKIAPLFGDGAGAVLMTQGDATQGLICYQLGSDGGGGPLLQCTAGGTREPERFQMGRACRSGIDRAGSQKGGNVCWRRQSVPDSPGKYSDRRCSHGEAGDPGFEGFGQP